MRKQTAFRSFKSLSLKLLLIVITICFTTINCKKDKDEKQDDPLLPVNPTDIQKPANHTDPAILPGPTSEIRKYDGEFTPLISDIIANWRIFTALRFRSFWYQDCWSYAHDEYYEGVTRSNITGKKITYQKCGDFPNNKTLTVDFSGSTDDPYWGQYKKGVEVLDSTGHVYNWGPNLFGWHYTGNADNLIRYHRYYTIPDLPDAYIMMHRRWEVVPIDGLDYAWCFGCNSLTRETSTTTGLSVEKTKEWGYTLGYEYTLEAGGSSHGVFISAAHTFSAEVQQRFQTTIAKHEEKTETITLIGTAPPGYEIIRMQVFREIATFKLVNQDGNDYYPGVYSPEIETTTQVQTYFWYYK